MDLDSEIDQQQHLVIAESFTLEFNIEGEGDFDMLYHYGSIDDIWLGNWGIFRTFEKKVPHLIPLPDREMPPKREERLPNPTGKKPPIAQQTGKPYPPNAVVRKYEVVALNTPIRYNDAGDHDPYGLIFALKEDVPKIEKGDMNPEPLIIRANSGEWVEITLHNRLEDHSHHEGEHGYPFVPVNAPFPPSKRISLHAQHVIYDVRHSDGATVGFNHDQTIAPGQSITYRWYIDRDFGSANLWDMADVRNHRHHGAFGMLIAEPKGSDYLDPMTREEVNTGSQVVISNPLLYEFREFALLMHDGVRLVDKNGKLIIDPEPLFVEPEEELADPEDQGSRGFNYRSERFHHRIDNPNEVYKVFSTKEENGDPATPLFLTYPGDPVTFRFVFPSDKPRTHTFTIHGHKFFRSRRDENSSIISADGFNTVGSNDNFDLLYGAGGLLREAGDYLYRSGLIRWDIELGMWGIMRVLKDKTDSLKPLQQKPNKVYKDDSK